jgi:glutathione S-transferase
MKLYGHPISTCTQKILLTLAEKGHKAEFELVDLTKGAHKSPDYLAKHPFGVVPFLDDDGYTIYESRAIIRYLDRTLSGMSLTPKDDKAYGRMERMIGVEQSYFTPGWGKIAFQLVFGRMQGKEPDMAVVDQGKAEVAKAFDVVEKEMAGCAFLAGNEFSLADVTWMPYVAYLFKAGEGALVTDRPNVAAWWKRVSERPTWQKIVG